jgi:hypothetical protein
MSQETNTSFTAEDMIRYHRGELSPREMHRLEKAALDDAFLAEALEGYSIYTDKSLPIPSISLNKTNQANNQSDAKIIPFSQRLKYMIAVAAIFILVFSIYLQVTESKQDELPIISQNRQAPSTYPSAPKDSQLPQSSPNPLPIKTEAPSAIKNNANSTTTDNQVTAPISVPVTNQKTVQADAKPETAESEPNVAQDALADAPPAVAMSADDVTVAGSQTKDLNAKKEAMDNDKTQSITVDVVSTTTGSPRRKAAQKTSVASQQSVSIEPIGGWQAYDTYIKQQRIACKDKQGNNIKGVVKVQFMIMSDGSVDRLEASSSLPDDCKEIAKEIVKNGPRWQSTVPTMHSIDIPFE